MISHRILYELILIGLRTKIESNTFDDKLTI